MSQHRARIVSHTAFLSWLACFGVTSYAQFGQTVQYFPQVAVGGGAITVFSIHNPGQVSATIELKLFGSDTLVFHEAQTVVPAGGMRTLTVGDSQQPLKRGWARLTATSGQFTATEFFQLSIGGQSLPRVGVLPCAPAGTVKFFAYIVQGQTNTGVAMANPSESKSATLTLRRISTTGAMVGSTSVTLAPHEHLARYLNEAPLFPGVLDFEGVVELESTEPVVVLMLRSDNALLSAAAVLTPLIQALQPGGVTTEFLADGAVTANKLAANSVTGTKIAAGQVVRSLNGLTDQVTLAAGSNINITPSGNTLTIAAAGGGASGDITAVNAGSGLSGGGTSGSVDLALLPAFDNWLNLAVALVRLDVNSTSPNIVAGHPANVATAQYGATIGGGGKSDTYSNQVSGDFGTISGGYWNRVAGEAATVSGGLGNKALAYAATVAGGQYNKASNMYGTIAGGNLNTVQSDFGTVGGGLGNYVEGPNATIAGGYDNQALGTSAFVAGGANNYADGDKSFAAGSFARALHKGTFVWQSGDEVPFQSSGNNQFLINASAGVGINTNAPTGALHVIGQGGTAEYSTIRAHNSQTSTGMAAYLTNQSGYATAHLRNDGSGEVMVVQSSAGRFCRMVNEAWDAKFDFGYNGTARADGSWVGGGADFAELLPGEEGLEPGDVLVIGPNGELELSRSRYESTVAGVYSTRPGFVGGGTLNGDESGKIPLAIVGVAPVKVTVEGGPIRVGDLLVSSSTPGHAMRAGTDAPQGTVMGKAMENLQSGSGMIRVLISLQ